MNTTSGFEPNNLERNGTMSDITASAFSGKTSQRRQRRMSVSESIEFRALVALSFGFCLIGFALRRISGRAPAGSSYLSCITDAKSAAYAAVGYAFHA